MFSSHPNIGKI
jgi:hypothetical protein